MNSENDIYILYYDENWHSAEAIYKLVKDIRGAVAPKPVVALPKQMNLQGFSREDFMNIMFQMLGGKPDFIPFSRTERISPEGHTVDSDELIDVLETATAAFSKSKEDDPIGSEDCDKLAHWEVWNGWMSNHDQRIEAKCTRCGYKHPTIYHNVNNLSPVCPGCHSIMRGVRYFG